MQWIKGNAKIETDEGEWRDGRQIGKGVQNWPTGRYDGELANGEPNGRGVLTFQKLRYDGEFRDGKPNGIGSLTEGSKPCKESGRTGVCRAAAKPRSAFRFRLAANTREKEET